MPEIDFGPAFYPIFSYFRRFDWCDIESRKLDFITQVASELEHMHKRSVVHGDLKGRNILINDKGSALFGQSRIPERLKIHLKKINLASQLALLQAQSDAPNKTDESAYNANPATTADWRWIAPECFTSSLKGPQSDVYSFAMTVLEIYSGQIPFWNIKSDPAVIMFVAKGGRPQRQDHPEIPSDLWALLEKCWDAEPSSRPTMARVHELLRSMAAPRARL